MDNLSLFVKLGLDMQKFEKGLTQASQKMQAFGKSMTKTGKDLSMKVTAPVVGLGAVILNTAGNFEAAMNKVQAVSGATGSEFEALEKQARELGATTQFSATQAAEAMTFLSMAGFEANEILGAMPSTLNLAAAAQLDMGSAADIVSNIMAGFNMTSEELSGAVDVLAKQFTTSNTNLSQLGEAMKYVAPVASGLGVSIEETSAAIGILSDAGIQASMAGTGLRRILSTLAQRSDELGVSVYNSDGSLRDLADIMQDLEGQGLSTSKVMEVFGERGGPALIALLSRGSDAIREQTAVLAEAGGTADRIAKTQMQGLNGALKALRSAFEELFLAIADSGLLDSVTSFARRLTETVRSLSETNPRILRMATVVAALAAALGPLLIVIGQMSLGVGALAKAMKFALPIIGKFNLAFLANPYVAAAAAIGALGVAIYGLVAPTKAATIEQVAFEEALKKQKTAVDKLVTSLDKIKLMREEEARATIESTKNEIKAIQDRAAAYEQMIDSMSPEALTERINKLEEEERQLLEEMANGVQIGTQLVDVQRRLDDARNTGAEQVNALREDLLRLRDQEAQLKTALEQAEAALNSNSNAADKNANSLNGLDNSAKSASKSIFSLKSVLMDLRSDMETMSENERLINSFNNAGNASINMGHKIASTAPMLKAASTETNGLINQMGRLEDAALQVQTSVQQYMVDGLVNGVQTMISTIGRGGNVMESVIGGILGGLADLAIQIGKIVVASGIAIEGLQKALKSLAGGGAAVVAGLALIAVGTAAKGMLGNLGDVPAFAEGGIVSGPTLGLMGEYAGAKSNPEVIAPLNKLQSMMGGVAGDVRFEIEGDKLVGILHRNSYQAGRL